MGAAGSTANSCSSLDMRRRQRKQQQVARRVRQPPLKYGRATPDMHLKMRHSNSYFELSQQQQQQQCPQASGQRDSRPESNLKPSRMLLAAGLHHHAPPQGCRRAAGVASRIQRKSQPASASQQQLKKLSDSLPSLLLLPPEPHYHHHNLYYRSPSPACRDEARHRPPGKGSQQQAARLPQPECPRKGVHQLNQAPAKQLQLVNRNNELQRHRQLMCPAPARGGYLAGHLSPQQQQQQQQHQQQQMKRATSLSALHNGCSPVPYRAAGATYDDHDDDRQTRLLASNHNRPAGQLQRHSAHRKQQPLDTSISSQHAQQPPQAGHSQMGKRFSKLKQALVGGAQQHLPAASRKYKPKQARHSPTLQGCPVLPPLPRSQSLHEIVQLRSTENGQRMRTTGTLRGGPEGGGGGGEAGARVNLVVELLEKRRRERRKRMLSRSSSFDDGIHDISRDQSGAEDSGQSSAASIPATGAPQHEASSNPQPAPAASDAAAPQSKQRLFKKNSELHVGHKRFLQQQAASPLPAPAPEMLEASTSQPEKKQWSRQRGQPAGNLKRASSHSALHQPANEHRQHRQHQQQQQQQQRESLDADESDDLNELARFLYQFKQRQASKSAAKAHSSGAGTGALTEPLAPNYSPTTPVADSTAARHQKLGQQQQQQQQQQTSLQQQSPNSTTSSSGFASSICTTSNSISSSNGGSQAGDQVATSKKPTTSQKKFTTTSDKTTTTAANNNSNRSTCYDKQAASKSSNKPLISGKLKLSSSLLSIVDEYNNNNTGTTDSAQKLHCKPAAKLECLLLGGAQQVAASSDEDHDAQEQYSKLERLHRYTRLRQLSQSELALNHLISSASLGPPQPPQPPEPVPADSQSRHQRPTSDRRLTNSNSSSNNKKPTQYRSKLFSLIKRVSSEKPAPEVGNNGDYVQKHARLLAAGGPAAAAANQAPNSDRTTTTTTTTTTNQWRQSIDQTGALYLNQFGQHTPTPGKALGGTGNSGAGHNKSSPGPAQRAKLSESLCDLNFDCDYELIKNCGRPAKCSSLLARAANQNSPSASPASAKHCRKGTAAGKRGIPSQHQHQHQHQQQQHQQNNWRLATSISLEKADRKACRSTCSTGGGGGDKLHQSVAGGEPCKPVAPLPIKLKWSASGWLMGSSQPQGKCGVCSGSGKAGVQSKQLGSSSKLPKLMWPQSHNGTPHNDAQQPVTGACHKCPPCACLLGQKRTRGGATTNQLPEETGADSITCADGAGVCLGGGCRGLLARPDAEEDIMRVSEPLCSYYLSAGESNGDEDEDDDDDSDEEEDEDAYASLNRAMIKATFDVASVNHPAYIEQPLDGSRPATSRAAGKLLLVHEPGSLSDSFTFSNASTGEPAAIMVAASQIADVAKPKPTTTPVNQRPLSQPEAAPKRALNQLAAAAVNLNDNFILKRKTPNAGLKS